MSGGVDLLLGAAVAAALPVLDSPDLALVAGHSELKI